MNVQLEIEERGDHPPQESSFSQLFSEQLAEYGASDVIAVSSTDQLKRAEDQFMKMIYSFATKKTEGVSLVHWELADGHEAHAGRKHPMQYHVTLDEGSHYIGTPMNFTFPKEGVQVIVKTDDGSVPLLTFVRRLNERPGHLVTFFRGTLTTPDRETTLVSSHYISAASPTAELSVGAAPPARHATAHRVEHIRERSTELSVPASIQHLFKLPQADRDFILDRMTVQQRDAVLGLIYQDAAGVHRRRFSDAPELDETHSGRASYAYLL